MTKSRGVGRGGARANAGRQSADGADVVETMTAYLDQNALDIVNEYGGGTIGIRMALRAFSEMRLQPIAKKRVAVGTANVIPLKLPKLREVPEFNADGARYNVAARMRLEREAQADYEQEMVEYRVAMKVRAANT